MNTTLFSHLPLSPEIVQNLETLGYHEMTPIQAQTLPHILNNQDILAKAKTGSGKTAAFGLGLLSKIDPQRLNVQSLVICPTRELADQVGTEIRRLARLTPNIRVLVLCGGRPARAQIESLRNGAHIVVGTPGRLQDHIEKNRLVLDQVRSLVLDEADRMLDMGFYDDIMAIIKNLPLQKQTCLFSATYPPTIRKISQIIQKNPVEILLNDENETSTIEQVFYEVEGSDKNSALIKILAHYSNQSVIIFCQTKKQCDEVATFFQQEGYGALPLHGDLEQRDREEILLQFSNKSCSILVATDVAARGLDIKDLPMVVNYELPRNLEVYIHRIGRTGRAGKTGLALSLFTAHERYLIKDIEQYTQSPVQIKDIKSLNGLKKICIKPSMRTLCINAGKKNKIRPGDILGALVKEAGLPVETVGKIDISDYCSYVAIDYTLAAQALQQLREGKIKGHSFKIRYL